MTQRQLQILRFIARSCEEQGWPPTVREMVEELGVSSKNSISDHLKKLEDRGMVERVAGVARGIRLTDDGRKTIEQYSDS